MIVRVPCANIKLWNLVFFFFFFFFFGGSGGYTVETEFKVQVFYP